ncbi:MAG TPA: hypothetical protein PKD98_21150, partial [Anaerolineae bacterium]|nr:hypothetical protein [Anaerolineae bacterium]
MRQKSTLLVIGLLFVLTTAVIGLNLPGTVHAGPLPGFTPQPPSTPSPGGNDNDRDSGRKPKDFVYAQFELCTLCPGGGQANEAGIVDDAGQPYAISAPVRLVHQGSGFIVEGTLPSEGGLRLGVPYPGKYDVYLLGSPQSQTGQSYNIDFGNTNLEQIQTSLNSGPVLIDSIEANTVSPYLVRCPLTCLALPTPIPTPQPQVPAP